MALSSVRVLPNLLVRSEEETSNVAEVQARYHAGNIENGMEWAAEEIHQLMTERLDPDTDPDEPIEPPFNPRDQI